MGNQQERTARLNFLAGLIVGEGSFCLGVSNYRGFRIKPIFQIKMTDRETMALVIDILRENDLAFRVSDDLRGKGEDLLLVRIDGMKRVSRLLDVILDLLTGQKRKAALLVSEFIESRRPKSNYDCYTAEDLETVRKLREINGVKNGRKNPLVIPRDYTLGGWTGAGPPKPKI